MIVNTEMTKLPKCCEECMYESIEGDCVDPYSYCTAVKNREIVDDNVRLVNRMPWCPLREYKNEKES